MRVQHDILEELSVALKDVVDAKESLDLLNLKELYQVRKTCPSFLHKRKESVIDALHHLRDALVLLQHDLIEELEDSCDEEH